MNSVIILLFVFVALGLWREQLGRATYALMGVAILGYIAYAYYTG